MVADAVHSLSDLVADALTLLALQAARLPGALPRLTRAGRACSPVTVLAQRCRRACVIARLLCEWAAQCSVRLLVLSYQL